MAQADEVDNSYLQVIFLKCITVLLGQLKLQSPVDFDYGIHLTESALFQARENNQSKIINKCLPLVL